MTTESQISDREREILQLVANGATNQQIAQELSISVNTVKVHLRNIFPKIGVVSRTEATLYAVRTGIIQVDPDAAEPAAAAVEEDEEPAESDDTNAPPPPATEQAPAAAVPLPPDSAVPAQAVPTPVTAVVPATYGPAGSAGSAELITAGTLPEALPPARRRLAQRWFLVGGGVALLIFGLVWLLLQATRPAQPLAPPVAEVDLPELEERWRELAPMPEPRAGFALTSYSFGGRSYLYAIGGNTANVAVSDEVLRYDLSSNVWVSFRAKPTAVTDVQGVVIGNQIFIPGGRLDSGEVTAVFEAYDPQRDTWDELAPLPEPRSSYALAALEGKLYLFGGLDATQAYRSEVWQYSPDRDEWSDQIGMPTARAFAGAAVYDGLIYVIGGEDSTGKLNNNESYSPAVAAAGSNPWSVKAPIATPRSRMGVATINNLVFLLGGADADETPLLYNSRSDSWELLETPFEVTLQDSRAHGVGNNLYILGGQGADSLSAKTYEYQAVYSVLLPLNHSN